LEAASKAGESYALVAIGEALLSLDETLSVIAQVMSHMVPEKPA
jgi:hypothetical protein